MKTEMDQEVTPEKWASIWLQWVPSRLRANIVLDPALVVGLVRRAKRPLMVLGNDIVDTSLNGAKAIDYAIKIAYATETPIVALAPETVDPFLERGFRRVTWINPASLSRKLRDRSWKGFDGKGCYDVVVTMGIPFHIEWMMLSGLKHFCPQMIIISLDRIYQPHATWSLPTLSFEDWRKCLEYLLEICMEELPNPQTPSDLL